MTYQATASWLFCTRCWCIWSIVKSFRKTVPWTEWLRTFLLIGFKGWINFLLQKAHRRQRTCHWSKASARTLFTSCFWSLQTDYPLPCTINFTYSSPKLSSKTSSKKDQFFAKPHPFSRFSERKVYAKSGLPLIKKEKYIFLQISMVWVCQTDDFLQD